MLVSLLFYEADGFSANWDAVSSLAFPPFNETARAEVMATLESSFEPLRKLTPGMGAYLNEVSTNKPPPLRVSTNPRS